MELRMTPNGAERKTKDEKERRAMQAGSRLSARLGCDVRMGQNIITWLPGKACAQ
jgi:hypothetical protein